MKVMADTEKVYYANGGKYTKYQMVKKGIENCLLTSSEEEYEAQCEDCPYFYPDVDCGTCKQELRKDALELLKSHPQIVRCKDCKHGRIYENCVKCENAGNPGMFATYHRIDWFCADGERKE